jgi:YesN/AraC family two-component response regulator
LESLRLVVADDHDIVRRGLRDLLEAHVGWKVVAEAATGTDAVTKVREFSPDVAILDISMPSLNGSKLRGESSKADRKPESSF